MTRKVAITMNENTLLELDRMVLRQEFSNRSKAIETLVLRQLKELRKSQFLNECAKLDPREERAIAEEGMGDATWPEY